MLLSVATGISVLGEQINIVCRQMVRTSEQEQLWLMARPRAPCQEYLFPCKARAMSDMHRRCRGGLTANKDFFMT